MNSRHAMKKIELGPEHEAMVREMLMKHVPDREVWAFGSRVTGTAKKNSDLDLAVMGDEPLPARVRSALNEAFDESKLPFQVDVVEWAATGKIFRDIISRDHLVLKGRTV